MSNTDLRILTYFVVMLLLTALFGIYSTETEKNVEVLAKQNSTLQTDNDNLLKKNSEYESHIIELSEQVYELQAQLERKEAEVQKVDRSGKTVRYKLTDAERDLVECVVTAEAGGESYEGQMLVAQCILNACEIGGIRPAEAIKRYVYAKGRPEPTDSVVSAVAAVFDKGETVTDEAIIYFYAPGKVKSKFHESQRFICEVGGHRFFAEQG